MDIFTKENIYSDKPVPVVNLPLVRFIGVPKRQEITGIIKGYLNPHTSVEVVKAVGVPVEEVLSDIGMNSRKAVIHL